MKKFLLPVLALGLVLAGCNKSTRTETASTDSTTATTADQTAANATAATSSTDTMGNRIDRAAERTSDSIANASRDAANAMSQAGRDISARLTEWRLSTADIEADLAANRTIVRTKDASTSPTGTVDRSTIKTAIEGRLKADPSTAGLSLDVNANRSGEVELEGKAQTVDQVARAMALALDTDGVSKVSSKIKLDKDAGNNR